MNLIIVESPTKARTLSRFLSRDFVIKACLGHVRDLPKSNLGVDVKNNFKPEYEISKPEVADELKKTGKKAKAVILATDPDREGEAIAYHVYVVCSNEKLKIKNEKFKRITFHEITKSAIEKALENPGSINMRLVNAQQARRVLDRLVGYKLSPLLWRKVRRGLSAGRVQSVAVRLIVEREKEIKAFKPQEYWIVGVRLCKQPRQRAGRQAAAPESGQASSKQQEFIANLVKIEGKKVGVRNREQAERVVADLKKATFRVQDVVKKEVANNPMPPYITSTLQRAGASLFGWSSKKTMREAQRLYEAGFITYHRTDSVNLSHQAVSKLRDFIKLKYGEKYLSTTPRIFKTKSKLAQEAHEAIRPTRVVTSGKLQVAGKIGRDGLKLYNLIFKRFLACQMAAEVCDKTDVFVTTDEYGQRNGKVRIYLLKASGQIQKFEGWKRLYESTKCKVQSAKPSSKLKNENNEIILPELVKDEILRLIKVMSEQKFTEAQGRYTESTLIKTLEALGIGRPSTYAPTISTIQTRKYVEKKDGKFYPTPVGETVTEFLMKYFSDIMNYQFTAEMEEDLDRIARGEKKWVPTIKNFFEPFSKKLKEVTEKAKRVKIEVEKTGERCPLCGKGEEVIRVGRFGKFLSCSRFPECRYTKNYLEKVGVVCPECKKGEVVMRRTKKGRQFYGCSLYPTCKWASWQKPRSDKEHAASNK